MERLGQFGLIDESRPDLILAGRHVDQIQLFLEAKERLTSVMGSEPQGVLLLDSDRKLLQADDWCIENLGLDIETCLGADLKPMIDARLFRGIHESLEFIGEVRPLTTNVVAFDLVGLDGDVFSIGFWEKSGGQQDSLNSSPWIGVSEVLREFMDVDSLKNLGAVTFEVMEMLGGGSWAVYLPVQGSLTLVCGSDNASECFFALLDPREFDEGFVIPAGYPDGILKRELTRELTVAPIFRDSRLACVFLGEGKQEDIVEVARWIGSALRKF